MVWYFVRCVRNGLYIFKPNPRDGFRGELGWWGVAGSAVARAEAMEDDEYGDLVRAAGAARFERACVEGSGIVGRALRDMWVGPGRLSLACAML